MLIKIRENFNSLLTVSKDDRSSLEIIGWWEARRFLYNLIVLIAGLTSMGIMLLLVNLKPGEDLQEPLAIIAFGILCNMGYTLGWITELTKDHDKSYGPKMFKVGLFFTLFWVFLPAFLHIIFWIGRGFTRMN